MWFHLLKYTNKPVHIQHKINKGYHYIKKNPIKHPWIQLYKHLEKNNKQTYTLKYKERV